MNVVKIEKFNTNNGWGFGGGIGTKTIYDNGLIHVKGKAYYRHLGTSKYQKYEYRVNMNDPYFDIDIEGVKNDNLYIFNRGEQYRAYFGGPENLEAITKRANEFLEGCELTKTIQL